MFQFLGLVLYAALMPDNLGIGHIRFESSYGFARLSFLLVTLAFVLTGASVNQMWDIDALVEFMKNFQFSPTIVKLVYFLLGIQMLCFLLMAIEHLEWQALLPIIAGYWLEAPKKMANFLIMYVVSTGMSFMFDIVTIATMPEWMTMTQGVAFMTTLFWIVFVLKIVVILLLYPVWQQLQLQELDQKVKDAQEIDPDIAPLDPDEL